MNMISIKFVDIYMHTVSSLFFSNIHKFELSHETYSEFFKKYPL